MPVSASDEAVVYAPHRRRARASVPIAKRLMRMEIAGQDVAARNLQSAAASYSPSSPKLHAFPPT